MEMELGPLFGLWFQSLFVGITMWALTICIFIITFGRMIEIYLVTSVAPIPMATMNIHFVEGECRHIPRYDKCYRFGLLYSGQADRAYLNRWMERVMLDFAGKSIGAYPITEVQEVISCIW